MKKILIIPIILAVLAISGCTPIKQQESASTSYKKTQQEQFDSILVANEENQFKVANSIKLEEFNDSVKLSLGHYMDSIKIIKGWKGKIYDIKKVDFIGTELATFTLGRIINEDVTVEFKCIHERPHKSTDKDTIFNIVKEMSDYSDVYFDGYIKTENGKVVYDNSDDLLLHERPKFKFVVTDIREANK